MSEPEIRARWSTAEKVGGCTACGERMLRIKEIQIGNFTFRLCATCIGILIVVMRAKR